MASSKEGAQDNSRMPPALDESIATASDMAPGSHTVSEIETQRSFKNTYIDHVKKKY